MFALNRQYSIQKGIIMKKNGILLALVLAFSMNANAIQKVIYGEDNRRDVYEVTNPLFLKMARSTAALIPSRGVQTNGNMTKIVGRTLGAQMGLCESEPFFEQTAAANCSGFLVAPNILVTAGHCVEGRWGQAADCHKYKYVFGFETTHQGQTEYSVPSENVYSCKRIIKSILDQSTRMDYAVIELDRPVVGREPMPFRKQGKIADGQEVVVIGHPSGIPTKIADGAFVRNNSRDVYFSASLDTYGGNSGSAVFNVTTGEIEGILVRGDTDYVRRNGCVVSNQCSMDGCRGEDVTRITNVAEIQNL